MTQAQLASLIGTDQSVVSRLERDRYPVTLPLIRKICDATGLPLSRLASGESTQ